ncbi:hypothetical protein AXG93_700s1020 [Marchantia polymorpha subsp. ruderalis]|uniref:NADP-dependent oxidoreductase domain-containing protein n=1 Tax=Marchantia polymorpha subsp. ruderalis TaxID=1480154 RepID=A0A176WNJ6_MARPO|nr:hypothetical protein AXG93_700s1020 [Marchantia polymorpha subsp. ruderalis]
MNSAAVLNVSKLCLGTMTFGEQNSYEDAREQLNFARESGINFFDVAEMYPVPQRAESQGKSEIYLGRWLKEAQVSRERVLVATKATGPSGQMTWIRGGPTSLDSKNIEQAIDGRYVPMFGDIDYDPTASYAPVPIEEQLEALSRAKEAGKIIHVGVSNETAYGVMEFCRLADSKSPLPRIVSIQNAVTTTSKIITHTEAPAVSRFLHLSTFCWSATQHSPLAMGLLSGKYLTPERGPKDARLNLYRGRYAEAESRYSFSKPNCIPAVTAYVDIARRHGISPVALAIGFVLRNPLIMSTVIGATKLWQLKEIVEASEVKLTAEVLSEINSVHERYPNPTP